MGANPRRANMQANRRRDTKPERALRRLLHARGLRYRVDYRVGQGNAAPRPDIAFTAARVAVFVDGCFWHGCPEHAAVPTLNSDYWAPKLVRTRERDAEDDRQLLALGWRVIRVWEHDDFPAAADRIEAAVRDRAPGRARRS